MTADHQDSLSDANTPTEDGTISFPVEREAGKAIAAHLFVRQRDPTYNFFQSFQNALYFKLARFFYTVHVPKARIDECFKDGFLGWKSDTQRSPLAPMYRIRFSFRSAQGFYRKLNDMISDSAWKNGFVDFRLGKGTEFWYRDILQVLKYLLRRKSFAPHMFWVPVKNFDGQHERVYMEMNTASWWWDTQVQIVPSECISQLGINEKLQMTLPVGSTLVPVLFTSDTTHLTNFSGDGKVWPLYMSIVNIRSSIMNKPKSHAWVPVAILPNSPKRIKKVPGWSEDKQEHEAMQVLHDLLKFILRLLSTSARDGHDIKCRDEVVRNSYFRVCNGLPCFRTYSYFPTSTVITFTSSLT